MLLFIKPRTQEEIKWLELFDDIFRVEPTQACVQFWAAVQLVHKNRLPAFLGESDGQLLDADGRCGSGGDCDLIKNITNLNGRY